MTTATTSLEFTLKLEQRDACRWIAELVDLGIMAVGETPEEATLRVKNIATIVVNATLAKILKEKEVE
jgi:predicted RNase H-like HicB family nuclease